MKIRLVTYLIAAIALLFIAPGCGHGDKKEWVPPREDTDNPSGDDNTDRPGTPGLDDNKDFDFDKELDDHDSRIYGLGQAIRYGETPGALFKRTDSAIEIVDITSGRIITYSLTDGTLTDSGRKIPLSAAEIIRNTTSEIYIHLLTADRTHIVIAVTDL